MARLERLKSKTHHWGQHRRAWSILLRETGGRCAYSLVHVDDCGQTVMEVDHFDPTLRGRSRNFHRNLLAAHRSCNLKKSDYYPTQERRAKGLYLLNPYVEMDYGPHIVERLESGELVGLTVPGKFHVTKLDLNAPFLVKRRLTRTQIFINLRIGAVTAAVGREWREKCKRYEALLEGLAADMMATAIPPLPQFHSPGPKS